MCCELRDISAHYSCIITISSCYNGSVCHLPFIAQPTSMGGTPSATLWRWEATSTTVYYAYKVESHGDLAHKPWYPGSSAGTPPGGQHTIVETHVIRPTGSGTLAAPLLPQRHGSRLTTWVAFPCPRILLDSGSGRRQQRTVDSTSRWRARSKNFQKARSRIAGDPGIFLRPTDSDCEWHKAPLALVRSVASGRSYAQTDTTILIAAAGIDNRRLHVACAKSQIFEEAKS